MVGLINVAAGLSAAGYGVANWAHDAGLQAMKQDLELQQLQLSDKLIRDREQAAYERSHSPEALAFAGQSAAITAQGSATGAAAAEANPIVQANKKSALLASTRAQSAAQADPEVLANQGVVTQTKAEQEAAASVLPDVLAAKITTTKAEAQARQAVENSQSAIDAAARKSFAMAEAGEKGRQKAQTEGINIEALDQAAQLFLKYKIAPVGMSRSAAMSNAWQDALARNAKQLGMSVEQINEAQQFNATSQKTMTAFSPAGLPGRQVVAQNSVIGHMDLVQEAAKALQNSDFPALNRLKNAWLEAFGSAVPTNFDALAEIVAPEVVKAVVVGGGGVTDREDMKKLYKNSAATGQILGTLEGQRRLIARQLLANEKAYEAGTHRTDFRDRLLPDTVQFLETIGKEDPSQKGVGPGPAVLPGASTSRAPASVAPAASSLSPAVAPARRTFTREQMDVMPHIKTQEDIDRLPPGTYFVTPGNTVGQRP